MESGTTVTAAPVKRPASRSTPEPTPGQSPFGCVGRELTEPIADLARIADHLLADFEALCQPQVREMLLAVHCGALALTGLVDNLLTATAMETGQFRIQPQPLHLLDAIIDALPGTTLMLTQQAHRLRLHARQGLPHVSADRRHIGRALINLISNASDVTEPETPISVRLSQQGRSVRVTVSDRGPRLLNRSRAHRFEGRRTPGMLALWGEEGSSLGLAIVEAVIDAHGGSVGEANRPGGGAHVWFELPASSVPVVA